MHNLLDLLFLGFSVNLILSCILTITAFNAVGALIALIFAFINATCIFFLMELEFVGLLFLIIYVGAISVLFLFAVMLFNLKDVVRARSTSSILINLLVFISIAIVFLGLFQHYSLETYDISGFVFDLNHSKLSQDPLLKTIPNAMALSNKNDFSSLMQNNIISGSVFYLGQIIYGRYLLYLILAGMVLLVAMLGAVTLINIPKEQSQMQHTVHQITRNIRLTALK